MLLTPGNARLFGSTECREQAPVTLTGYEPATSLFGDSRIECDHRDLHPLLNYHLGAVCAN
jgi:hypothetical protein